METCTHSGTENTDMVGSRHSNSSSSLARCNGGRSLESFAGTGNYLGSHSKVNYSGSQSGRVAAASRRPDCSTLHRRLAQRAIARPGNSMVDLCRAKDIAPSVIDVLGTMQTPWDRPRRPSPNASLPWAKRVPSERPWTSRLDVRRRRDTYDITKTEDAEGSHTRVRVCVHSSHNWLCFVPTTAAKTPVS